MIDNKELMMVWNALLCFVMYAFGWFSCLIFGWVFRAIKMEKYEDNKIQKNRRSSYTPE